jgi:hypothetical protein
MSYPSLPRTTQLGRAVGDVNSLIYQCAGEACVREGIQCFQAMLRATRGRGGQYNTSVGCTKLKANVDRMVVSVGAGGLLLRPITRPAALHVVLILK